MIRLAHPEITKNIEFEENKICSLVIENKVFFRKVISGLYNQINGEDGSFVLSEEYVPVDLNKKAEILTEFVPFQINSKSLQNKICATAEREAVNESNFAETQSILAEIERYIEKLLFQFPYEFEYEKLNISNIIKSVGISVNEDYDNGLEKIIDYMLLCREFDKEKIFIFVNLRCYYSDDEMECFAREIISRKFKVLFIDNTESRRLTNENRLIIDADLCEIF